MFNFTIQIRILTHFLEQYFFYHLFGCLEFYCSFAMLLIDLLNNSINTTVEMDDMKEKEKEKDSQKEGMELTILNAAEQLFLEKGFNGVSTTQIAQKVGCNQALIHYYYRTKANLFKMVFENKLRYLVSLFYVIEDESLSFEEKLVIRIKSHFDALAQYPLLPMFVLNEIRNNSLSDIIRQTFKQEAPNLISKLDMELRTEISAGRIREISAFDLLINIISLNIFVFLARPIMEYVLGLDEEMMNKMIENRKQEVVETILKSLIP